MNQFFGTQFTQEDLQQRLAQRRRNGSQLQRTSSMPMQAPMSQGNGNVQMTGMMGNSLDDIIMQNSTELRQRQDFSPAYPGQGLDRRASMVQFGSSNNDLQGFQFAPKSTAEDSDIRRQSTGELDLGSFSDMGTMNLQSPSMAFQSPMHAHDGLVMDSNTFMSPEMAQNMMGGFPSLDTGDFSENGMNLFSNDFDQPFNNHMGTISGNLQDNFMMPGSMQQDVLSSHRNSIQDDMPSMAGLGVSDSKLSNSPTKMTTKINQPIPELQPPMSRNSRPNTVTRESSYSQPETTPRAASPAKELELPTELSLEPSPYSNIYSQSGFDMLGALIKVASRKNPQINIGKVDLSCAFVVCDIHQPDCPIIYVSDVFERLTGYTKYEVLGRNCRFLQSPDGKVQAGTKRNFIDNEPVYYIKKRVAERKEVQRSLINYRKGGQPFVNLLTMIPITGEDDKDIRYYVGFQVDLVEKPTSVESKDANGMYTVDYSQGALPKYTWQPPENLRSPAEGGQTISRDDVSTVLNAINNGTESELTKRMWDKVLLENTDDVVHVLSLKGLFLYLSPSCRRVLEYDVSELVGTALSSVCHPSDIVPVTRELKDTSNGASVSVVFRIRRKRSGYTWFESHGSLCVEQGKGRKCIILVGRERPVYALGRQDIAAGGGICENEMWTKLSTSGMFLFVSTHVRTLLDRTPDELVGTSIQTLMRAESKVEFGRALEKARTGKCVTYKHDILNKRGLLLQAQTSLYPGDASEGSKPTFLVAQTRLLKAASRAGPSSKTSSTLGKENSSEKSPAFGRTAAISSQVSQEGERTPRSGSSVTGPITHAGGAGLPIGSQDVALASEQNIFEELKTTRSTSWQFELRQMEKSNRLLAEELASLLSAKKKRKRRKGAGHLQRDCANCHTRVTPEWRRGPSGQRDLCNSCGLRWAKQTGRVSPRTSSTPGDAASKHSNTSTSPIHSSPLQKEVLQNSASNPNLNPAPRAGAGNVKGESAAVPASLGGRTTLESQPVHKPSQGYREGGERGITRIGEEAEGFADAD